MNWIKNFIKGTTPCQQSLSFLYHLWDNFLSKQGPNILFFKYEFTADRNPDTWMSFEDYNIHIFTQVVYSELLGVFLFFFQHKIQFVIVINMESLFLPKEKVKRMRKRSKEFILRKIFTVFQFKIKVLELLYSKILSIRPNTRPFIIVKEGPTTGCVKENFILKHCIEKLILCTTFLWPFYFPVYYRVIHLLSNLVQERVKQEVVINVRNTAAVRD